MIDVYTYTWQENYLLPYFLRHYRTFADRIFVIDQSSTDGTREIALNAGCEIIHREDTQSTNIDEKRWYDNNVWRERSKNSDWVIIADIDELVYHANIREYLVSCKETIIVPVGWEMTSDKPPTNDDQLYNTIKYGLHAELYSKPCVFRPIAGEMNFCHGLHSCNPNPSVSMKWNSELKLLHYRFLGVDYICERWSRYHNRVDKDAESRGLNTYSKSRETVESYYRDWAAKLVKVV